MYKFIPRAESEKHKWKMLRINIMKNLQSSKCHTDGWDVQCQNWLPQGVKGVKTCLECCRRASSKCSAPTSASRPLMLVKRQAPEIRPETLVWKAYRWAQESAGDVFTHWGFENGWITATGLGSMTSRWPRFQPTLTISNAIIRSRILLFSSSFLKCSFLRKHILCVHSSPNSAFPASGLTCPPRKTRRWAVFLLSVSSVTQTSKMRSPVWPKCPHTALSCSLFRHRGVMREE